MNITGHYHPFVDRMKRSLLAHKEILLLCFISVFLWGFLAHGYGFLHNTPSHDSLNAFIATQTEEAWKIELGRFFVPLYRAAFRNAVALPWLIGIAGLIWTALALFLLVKILDLRSKVLIALIAGIMTTNISNIAQIAAYLYEFDFNSFSLMLSILAVYCWQKDKGLLSIIAGGICLMVSIGIYQAFFAVTVALIVWKSVMDLLNEKTVRDVFLHGIRGILIILLGCVLYLLAGKLIYHFTGIVPQKRTDPLFMDGMNPVSLYLSLIKPALVYLVNSIFHLAYTSPVFDISMVAVIGLLGLATMWMLVTKRFKLDRILFLFVLVGLMPFALTCVFFLSKGSGMHDLTRYSCWFFHIFILLLAFRLCEKDMLPNLKTSVLRAIVSVLILVILWQNVVLANTAYVKKELEYNAALSTMTRVVTMLEQQEDFHPKETEVAIIGTPRSTTPIYGMDRVNTILGLMSTSPIVSDASIYYYNIYKAYFSYILQYPIKFCPDDVNAKLHQDPQVLAIPAYPDENCMQMVDDVLIIKLGAQQSTANEVDEYDFIVK